ncbi:unnamed protein product [Moneuplotes crassus]|uniref:Uncharacterized protein n=1 Tax=Euplotes crassus TaxID=5936 RepID=A0AAD1U628_EUPCR|nr:unnamed protein product [Moneuplotes crassus]
MNASKQFHKLNGSHREVESTLPHLGESSLIKKARIRCFSPDAREEVKSLPLLEQCEYCLTSINCACKRATLLQYKVYKKCDGKVLDMKRSPLIAKKILISKLKTIRKLKILDFQNHQKTLTLPLHPFIHKSPEPRSAAFLLTTPRSPRSPHFIQRGQNRYSYKQNHKTDKKLKILEILSICSKSKSLMKNIKKR